MTPLSDEKVSVNVSRWALKASVSTILAPEKPEDRNHSVRRCGMARHDQDEVGLVNRGGRAGVTGAHFCKSVWLCPTCAPRMARLRAEEVGRVFDAATDEDRGGAVTFVTMTVRHTRSDALADLKALVQGSCRQARQGKPWALAKARYGILGTLVGPEATQSETHGWHFHLHCAVVVDDEEKSRAAAAEALEAEQAKAEPNADRVAELEAIVADPAEAAGWWLLRRYESYIAANGGSTDRRAQDVTVCWRQEDLAAYLSKGSLAWEVSNAGATKRGRKGRTPWDLAALAMGKGHRAMRARELFREYAAAMPGTRSCVVTASLAKALGIKPTEKPKGPLEDEAGTLVLALERTRWHRLLGGGHVAPVFAAIERGEPKEGILRLIEARIGPPPWWSAPKSPPTPPPTRWTPSDRDILIARRSFSGSTAAQLSMVEDDLRKTARRKGLPLDLDPGRLLRLLGAGGG